MAGFCSAHKHFQKGCRICESMENFNMMKKLWYCSACEHTFEIDEDLVFTYSSDGMEFAICPVCALNVFLYEEVSDVLSSELRGEDVPIL